MKAVMYSFFCLILFALGLFMSADLLQAETSLSNQEQQKESNREFFSEYAHQLFKDARFTSYFQLKSDSQEAFLEEAKSFCLEEDMNKDGLRDKVVVFFQNKSSAVSLFLQKEAQGQKVYDYQGFIPVDSYQIPRVRSADITGDGKNELRIEGVCFGSNGALRRVLKYGSFQAEEFKVIFTTLLDNIETTGIYSHRSTRLIQVRDKNGDGSNEIIVHGRRVELISASQEKGNFQEEKKEIEESIERRTITYHYQDGAYQVLQVEHYLPENDQLLIVAKRLIANQEPVRARLFLNKIIDASEGQEINNQDNNVLIHQSLIAEAQKLLTELEDQSKATPQTREDFSSFKGEVTERS